MFAIPQKPSETSSRKTRKLVAMISKATAALVAENRKQFDAELKTILERHDRHLRHLMGDQQGHHQHHHTSQISGRHTDHEDVHLDIDSYLKSSTKSKTVMDDEPQIPPISKLPGQNHMLREDTLTLAGDGTDDTIVIVETLADADNNLTHKEFPDSSPDPPLIANRPKPKLTRCATNRSSMSSVSHSSMSGVGKLTRIFSQGSDVTLGSLVESGDGEDDSKDLDSDNGSEISNADRKKSRKKLSIDSGTPSATEDSEASMKRARTAQAYSATEAPFTKLAWWRDLDDPDSSVVAYIYSAAMNPLIFISVFISVTSRFNPPLLPGGDWVAYAQIIFDITFFLEVVLRFVVAFNKLMFLKDPFNIIDIIAAIPVLIIRIEEGATSISNFSLADQCVLRCNGGTSGFTLRVLPEWPYSCFTCTRF